MIAHINNLGHEESVYEHAVSVARRSKCYGDAIGLKNTAYLIGLMHDFGKNREIFKQYLKKARENPRSVKRGSVDHSTAGAKFLYERFAHGNEEQRLTAEILAVVILSHHGQIDMIEYTGKAYFEKRIQKEDLDYDEVLKNCRNEWVLDEIDDLFGKSVTEICEKLKDINRIIDRIEEKTQGFREDMLVAQEDAFDASIAFLERMLLSILIQADRIETARFMACGKCEDLIEEGDTDLWKLWQKNFDRHMLEKKKGSKSAINHLRQSLSEKCFDFAQAPPGIYTLKIPTGGGKTLSSLRYSLEHAIRYNKKRVLYVAPFKSILEQNAQEFRKSVSNENSDDSYNDLILEHHSNIIWEESTDNDIDEAARYHRYTETWGTPMILTTMVQFLNTLFDGSTQSIRRFHRLCGSIIIIDEIQSLPIKCVYLFDLMMNFLVNCCRVTLILCSATQPLLGTTALPILFNEPMGIIEDNKEIEKAFKRVKIIPEIIPGGFTTLQLTDFVLDKLGHNILIILNTKKAVRELYKAIKDQVQSSDIEVIELTTYMCAAQRSKKIETIKATLGNKRLICISTALIEAGVDLSFECVIRSLIGLDSIVQAAGRCNRNGETDIGIVYIIKYNEERLEKLPEMDTAQQCTLKLLGEYTADPGYFDDDLLSKKAMDRYYAFYFSQRWQEMGYCVNKNGDTLLKWLGFNDGDLNAYATYYGCDCSTFLHQAFKRAGKSFEVIGNHTIGIIVPYCNEEEIEKLRVAVAEQDDAEIRKRLRRLQPFTVNVYPKDSLLKQLIRRGAFEPILPDGEVLLLNHEFYGEEGITDDFKLEIV